MRSARRLMLIVIYMKFLEDNLSGFQVVEQTRVWQTDRCPVEKQYVSKPKREET